MCGVEKVRYSARATSARKSDGGSEAALRLWRCGVDARDERAQKGYLGESLAMDPIVTPDSATRPPPARRARVYSARSTVRSFEKLSSLKVEYTNTAPLDVFEYVWKRAADLRRGNCISSSLPRRRGKRGGDGPGNGVGEHGNALRRIVVAARAGVEKRGRGVVACTRKRPLGSRGAPLRSRAHTRALLQRTRIGCPYIASHCRTGCTWRTSRRSARAPRR